MESSKVDSQISEIDRIDEIVAQCESLRGRGQNVSVSELCGDRPDLAEEVARRIAALESIGKLLDELAATPAPTDQTPCDGGAEGLRTQGPPPTLGRYELKELVGQGGFGQVWLGWDTELLRHVAVKVPRLHRLNAVVQGKLFLEEARKAAKLCHPGIVPVFDYGRDGQYYYIISQWIDGPSLAKRIKDDRLTFEESARIVAEVGEALHHAHLRDLVHRDIKPGNILLDSQGKAYVTDFGIAVTEEELLEDSGSISGTLGYMSPEQAAGESLRVTPRTDIYSLGVVFYQLLTGRLPFRAEDPTKLRRQVLEGEARPPRTIDDKIPGELERVCLKAMAKEPGQRYTSGADIVRELRQWHAEQAGCLEHRTKGGTVGVERLSSSPVTHSSQAPPILVTPPPLPLPPPAQPPVPSSSRRHTLMEPPASPKPPSTTVAPDLTRGAKRTIVEQPKPRQVAKTMLASRKLPQPVGDARRQPVPTKRSSAAAERYRLALAVVVGVLILTAMSLVIFGVIRVIFDVFPDTGRLAVMSSSIGLEMIHIPAGKYQRGAEGRDVFADHKPKHWVEISRGFWVGKYPVTQGEYTKVMGYNPSYFSGGGSGEAEVRGMDTANFPVERVSWYDAIDFCNRASVLEDLSPYYELTNVNRDGHSITSATMWIPGGDGYRLLTEAEWEYMARAGSDSVFPWGDSLSSNQANFNGNYPYGNVAPGPYLKRTTEVGSYQHNGAGFYDTAGNVWEWVWDWYCANEYQQFANQAAVDPTGPGIGISRCLRGGSWNDHGEACRPANRRGFRPQYQFISNGFRVARNQATE